MSERWRHSCYYALRKATLSNKLSRSGIFPLLVTKFGRGVKCVRGHKTLRPIVTPLSQACSLSQIAHNILMGYYYSKNSGPSPAHSSPFPPHLLPRPSSVPPSPLTSTNTQSKLVVRCALHSIHHISPPSSTTPLCAIVFFAANMIASGFSLSSAPG